MPIGGANLPMDIAPVPIELGQVQVDHAIAKLTEQEEKQAAAAETTVEDAEDSVTTVMPTDDTNKNVNTGSRRGKGEFRTITHALKKKTETKWSYKCSVCGARKPSMQSLNDHHKRHHGPQMCGICR